MDLNSDNLTGIDKQIFMTRKDIRYVLDNNLITSVARKIALRDVDKALTRYLNTVNLLSEKVVRDHNQIKEEGKTKCQM